MEDPCILFKSQRQKAKEALDILEKQRVEINQKLESDASSASLHKDLRTVNLNIKITLNEIEHAEFNIEECEAKNNSFFN